MYKYFASYLFVKRRRQGIGNSVFGSNYPMCEELIREFEKQTKEDRGFKNVVVLSMQMLPVEEANERKAD